MCDLAPRLDRKSALVTGASGFLGSRLVAYLKAHGAVVWGLSHAARSGDNTRDLVGDVTNTSEVHGAFAAVHRCDGHPVDYVFHLAGQRNPHMAKQMPYDTLATGAVGTLNVLEAAREAGTARVLLISSVAVYLPSTTAVREDHPVTPLSVYAAVKLLGETLGQAYCSDHKVPVTVARLANVYGPAQSKEAVVASIASQITRGGHGIDIGNLDSVRDFIYVDDAVEALIHLAASENTSGRVFNVGTGSGTSIREILDRSITIAGYRGPVNVRADRVRAGEHLARIPDVTAIRASTGWAPKNTLDAGLRTTLDWFREHED